MKWEKSFNSTEKGIVFFKPEGTLRLNREYQYGKGLLNDENGSVYYGGLVFDGENYYKHGVGFYDMSKSWLSQPDVFTGEKRWFYVGEFDFLRHDIMYGKGIMYNVDQNNKPARFMPGIYKGLQKVEELEDYEQLYVVEGYPRELYSKYNQRVRLFEEELKKYDKLDTLENLFLGDSYFEFMLYEEFMHEYNFDEVFPHSLDLGIGSASHEEYQYFLEKLKNISEPKRIIVHLGCNDLHHSMLLHEIEDSAKKLYLTIKEMFPNAKIYALNTTHTPFCKKWWNAEYEYNKYLEGLTKELGITLIDFSSIVAEHEKAHSEINYFYSDGLHLSVEAYKLLFDAIKSAWKEED